MKLNNNDINNIINGYNQFKDYCGEYVDCKECPLYKTKRTFANKVDLQTVTFCEIPYIVNYIRKQERKQAKQEQKAQVYSDRYCAYRIISKPLMRKFIARLKELEVQVDEDVLYSNQKQLGYDCCVTLYSGRVVQMDVNQAQNIGLNIIVYNGNK